jgi:hypothetical protein
MNFKHNEHTEKYFSKSLHLSEKLRKFDWSSVRGLSINMNSGDDSLKYQFLKISSKLLTKIQDTGDVHIDNFLNDPNVLSLGIINIGAKSDVQIHKDHDYWLVPFHRIHIPLKNSGAYFIYGDEKIVWKTDEVYIFDVMGVLHGAVNATDDDFEMIYVDISQSPVGQMEREPLNALAREYQKKFLETVPPDLIFKEYKKQCTEEELEAEEKYLDHYKRNLEIG